MTARCARSAARRRAQGPSSAPTSLAASSSAGQRDLGLRARPRGACIRSVAPDGLGHALMAVLRRHAPVSRCVRTESRAGCSMRTGGLHPFGGTPWRPAPHTRPGWDIARAVVTTGNGVGGYVLDGWGALHAFGGTPAITDLAGTPGSDRWRSVVLGYDDRSGYVRRPVRRDPGVRTRTCHHSRRALAGGATSRAASPCSATAFSGVVVDRVRTALVVPRHAAQVGVAVGADGATATRSTPSASCARSVGAPDAGPTLWPGWEIARAVAVRADGVSGYVLDGYGGLHPFGGAARQGKRRRVLEGLGHRKGARAPSGRRVGVRARRMGRRTPVRRRARPRAVPRSWKRWDVAAWDLAARPTASRDTCSTDGAACTRSVARPARAERRVAGPGHRQGVDSAQRRPRMGARRGRRRASDKRRGPTRRASLLGGRFRRRPDSRWDHRHRGARRRQWTSTAGRTRSPAEAFAERRRLVLQARKGERADRRVRVVDETLGAGLSSRSASDSAQSRQQRAIHTGLSRLRLCSIDSAKCRSASSVRSSTSSRGARGAEPSARW